MSYYINLPVQSLEDDYHAFCAQHGNKFATAEEIRALITELKGSCNRLKRRDKATPEGQTLICGLTTARELLSLLEQMPGPVTGLEIVTDDYIGMFMHPSVSAAYLWVCQQIALRQPAPAAEPAPAPQPEPQTSAAA